MEQDGIRDIFPPAVKAVEIPKKSGGTRTLGIPTVADRIAQMVVKIQFEFKVEKYFHADSYGYRPGKSAHDAIDITRKRCWKYNWVLEFDIKGLFDNIDHELLMKAVRKHTKSKWELLYIQRWLTAPFQKNDGTTVERERRTPQGGVISPILANLFLHYCFDKWMEKEFPNNPWCRYADDAIIHCVSKKQAQYLRDVLERRFRECKLEIHPDKTRLFTAGFNRAEENDNINLRFLDTFRPKKEKRQSIHKLSPALRKNRKSITKKFVAGDAMDDARAVSKIAEGINQ